MFKRIVVLVLIVSLLGLTSGCASYRFGRLPSRYILDFPDPVTIDDVSVGVKFFTAIEAKTTFDADIMTAKKIEPVFIVIDNKSNAYYSFRKADVDPNYLTAEEAAKKCARSTMGRVMTYGLLGVFIIACIVLIPMAVLEAINCPRINARMRADYIASEIADATIAPGRSISGVIFGVPLASSAKFNVPLIKRETGQRTIFEFYKD